MHPSPNLSADELTRLINSAADHAIFRLDPNRHVLFWSRGAEKVFGYTAEDIRGQSSDILFTPEDREKKAPEREAEAALRDGRAEDERWHVRKNGERFFASGVVNPMFAKDGSVDGFVKIARDLTSRKIEEQTMISMHDELEERVEARTAELRASNEALRTEIFQREAAETAHRELQRRIATAQEEERLRLSRELHDGIGQHLAAVMLDLNSLRSQLREKPELMTELAKLQGLTETIGQEVHALAVQLRPTVLDDLGLLRAITTYVELWSTRTGIKVELHASCLELPRLPAEVELTLYRVVQEALTNILKHAKATHVSLVFSRQEGEVIAIIEDNGIGFDMEERRLNGGTGLGLLGMSERAEQLNGRLTVESNVGQGTTVFVRIPT